MNYSLKTMTALLLGASISMAVQSAGAADGKQVFDRWCHGCHADSPFAPGTIFLKASRPGQEPVIEKRTDLNAAFINTMVRNGFGGMPSFRTTEISDAELKLLTDYLSGSR